MVTTVGAADVVCVLCASVEAKFHTSDPPERKAVILRQSFLMTAKIFP